jgi:AcrR family transcriptional regulator
VTRQSVVAAARQLFTQRGYAGTTMPAVADQAGVQLDEVYEVAAAKPSLLGLVLQVAISGEGRPVGLVGAEPDPARKLALYANAVRGIQERLSPLVPVLLEAAAQEPELDRRWQAMGERRARDMGELAAELDATGALRVPVDEARDLLFAFTAPEFWQLLVEERGWTPDRFEQWLSRAWQELLLRA